MWKLCVRALLEKHTIAHCLLVYLFIKDSSRLDLLSSPPPSLSLSLSLSVSLTLYPPQLFLPCSSHSPHAGPAGSITQKCPPPPRPSLCLCLEEQLFLVLETLE